MKYRELLEWGALALKEAKIREYELDAWYLLEYATGITRAKYFLIQKEEAVTGESAYRMAIEKRRRRVPLQHITGCQEFMGLSFQVNEHVLIPRQDTEVLVELMIKLLPKQARVLDMCTGSGCIGISLAKLREAKVTAVDASGDAIVTAQKNAEALGCEARLTFYESDLFSAVPKEEYDAVVSNPPYIPSRVIAELEPEVRDFEPVMALDGKEDGLYFYRRIVNDSREYLKNGGILCFETGHDQRKAVGRLLKEAGFSGIQSLKDLAGLDRVIYGIWK